MTNKWTLASTCAALILAIASLGARGATETLEFDPPAFQNGQLLSWVGNVGFLGNAKVFQPASVTTQTPPYALGAPDWCEGPACTNGASRLGILLKKKASEISLRIGSEITPSAKFFCFPEGTDCGVYARLVAYDGANIIIDTRDVKLYDAGSTIGFGAPITRELKVSDPYGRISGAVLFVGSGTFSHDNGNPGRVQIDSLSVTFVEGAPPPPPEAPAAPTITFLQPSVPITYPYRFNIEGTWTAPAGLLALCVRVNEPIPVLNSSCTNNANLSGSNFWMEAYLPSMNQTGNVVNVGIVDLLGRKVTASHVITPAAPPPPIVSIYSPIAGTWSPSGGAFPPLSGSAWISGAVSGFCVRYSAPASPLTTPTAAQCTEVSKINATGQFSNITLDVTKLSSGPNDVSVFVFDSWGQQGHATVHGVVPANLRVSGVEVTQGSQTFAMNPTSGNYYGTELTSGLPTIVRVFASASAGGPFPGVNATLEGFVADLRHGGEKSLGLLLPDNGKQSVSTGPFIAPLSERAKPDSAFVFTLPTDWTSHGFLRLRAVLNNPAFSGAITECSACNQDNEVNVTQIGFKGPMAVGMISPVAIRWHDQNDAFKDPPPVEAVFKELRPLLPVADATLVVRPYVGRVDMGNTTFSTSTPPWMIDRAGNCTGACSNQVFGAVSSFAPQPGLLIGITDASLRGLTMPVPYFNFNGVGIDNVAMASTTFNIAPLKLQVSHEILHQFGYLHASGACGANTQLSEPWPPDLRGRLQGIGIDRRTGSGPVPGTYAIFADQASPADAYDVMSYCAPAVLSWLSPRYWDRFGQIIKWPATICLQGNCGSFGAPADSQPGLRVMAHRDAAGAWEIVSVTGSLVPRSRGAVTGSAKLVGEDGNGRAIAEVLAEPAVIDDEPDGRWIVAELPAASLKSIALMVDGRQVASRKASSATPTITITSPSGATLPSDKQELALQWTAQDADNSPLLVRVAYSEDDGRSFRQIGVTTSAKGMELPLRFFSASPAARIRLTVNDGFNETQITTPAFVSAGTPPLATIINPAGDITLFSTATVNLTGAAFDDRGIPIKADQLQWSVDGAPIGAGSDVLLPRLRPGQHTVEMRARDRLDRVGKMSRVLTVMDGGIEPIAAQNGWPWWIWIAIAIVLGILLLVWLLRRGAN
jgi:hypothetical protein